MKTKSIKKTCSRGHVFYKSSDCPVCPICWPSYAKATEGKTGKYREKNHGDFPDKMSAPALRALLNAQIFNLEQLSKYSEAEILQLHGMGPASLPTLREALEKNGLAFKIKADKSVSRVNE